MTGIEREVRAAVYRMFRDHGRAPSADELASTLLIDRDLVRTALLQLAADHALVLQADGDSIWMAHPFSGVSTDARVAIGARRWFANCVWDGLSIVGLLGGTGRLSTHSPATGASIVFDVVGHVVGGDGIIHFLVPAARFWDDIGFT